MKITSARRGTDLIFGVVSDDELADLSASFSSPQELVAEAHAEGGRSRIDSMAAEAERFSLGDVSLLPPVPFPRRILCVGKNYAAHIAESGDLYSVSRLSCWPWRTSRAFTSEHELRLRG
ncbi:MAG: hypothetical protein ACPF97_04520 [Ilumatobacteraceae bacterium]